MRLYFEWLKTVPAHQIAELERLSAPERIQRIRTLRREQQIEQSKQLANKELSRADLRALANWASHFVSRHEDEILAELPRMRQRFRNHDNPQLRRRMLMFARSVLTPLLLHSPTTR